MQPARAAHEDGYSLIEVVVSAAMVALLAGALFSGLESSSKTSADLRVHSAAQQLAQQDEDRMRGMRVSELANLNQTSTITVDGTLYTIKSTGDFLTDSTGTASCTSGTAAANYIETTSTITWPAIGTRSPVTAQSLITPPNGAVSATSGAVAVQVTDSRGAGVANITASLSGAGTASGATSSNGCIIFGDLPAGSYSASLAATGYVDKDGVSAPVLPVTVTGGTTATPSFQYDVAGSISYTFQTSVDGGLTFRASSANSVVAFNTNMSSPDFRAGPAVGPWPLGGPAVPGTPSPYATAVTATGVFPFISPYSVYAGSCVANDPVTNGQSSDPSVVVPQNGNVAVTLKLPPLKVFYWTGTSGAPGAQLLPTHVRLTDTGCANFQSTPAIAAATGLVTGPGDLADPGQPYGTYKVCADNNVKSYTAAGVLNKDPLLGTVVNLYLGSATNGICT